MWNIFFDITINIVIDNVKLQIFNKTTINNINYNVIYSFLFH